MRSAPKASVKRRKTFYIPGFDPFPPRRYRELYRKEGAAQAAMSGYALTLASAREGEGYGWQVHTEIEDRHTETDIEVLIWSDIVQNSFHDSIGMTYRAMLKTAWIYISTGALWRLMRLRKGPVIAAFYPIVMLSAQLALALFLSALGWLAVTNVLQFALPAQSTLWAVAGQLIALIIAGLLIRCLLRWFRAKDHMVFAYYLMHDFAHSAVHRGAYGDEISSRLEAFGEKIAQALTSDVDEVLVVGHSSGAHLAVTVLSDVIRDGLPPDRPALSLLSLGQVTPMVSFLPQAHRLRADLRYLSTSKDITWVDVTAPGDGCAFALCDPVGVSGQTTPEKRGPLVLSASFTQSLSPERWRALRWRFFRLHFQYLCAFDRPKDYDYFQITGGPMTLSQRYKNRPPSPSRITRSVSKYTSIS